MALRISRAVLLLNKRGNTMRKHLLLALMSVLIMLVFVTSCSEEPPKFYDVTFYDGERILFIENVQEGSWFSFYPYKDGYDFTGWYLDPDLAQEYDSSLPVTSNLSLYSAWKIRTYTINFDLDYDSEIVIPSQNVEFGGLITEPDPEPTRDGYRFLGWAEKRYGSLWDFSSDKVEKDVTLYAKWKSLLKYSVTIKLMNGEADKKITVTEGDLLGEIDIPERAGYKFSGWYDDASDKEFDLNSPINGNTTIYAKWEPCEYKVSFNTDGGTEISDMVVKTGESIKKPKNPEKVGHTFIGWYVDASYSEEYTFNETSYTGDVILYAKWEPIMIPVHFVTFSTEEIADKNVPYGTSLGELEDLSRSDYVFKGWFMDYPDCKEPYNPEMRVTEEITIYAKWVPAITVTLTWELPEDMNEKPFDPWTIEVGDGDILPDSAVAPDLLLNGEKIGFKGWSEQGSHEIIDAETYEITAPITLIARWKGYEIREDGTYEVSNEYGLRMWAEHYNDDDYVYAVGCVLTSDIDMGGSRFILVDAYGDCNSFNAEFDGAGHTISNFEVAGGFLPAISSKAVIKDLTLKDIEVSGFYDASSRYSAGGITGSSYGGVISNCHVINGTVGGYTFCGGIVGYASSSSVIENSSFDGVIDNASIAGGICGVSMSDSLVIACSSSGTIAGDDAAGGIIGTNRNTVGYNPVETVDSDVMVLVSNTDAELSGTKKGSIIGAMNQSAIKNLTLTIISSYASGSTAEYAGLNNSSTKDVQAYISSSGDESFSWTEHIEEFNTAIDNWNSENADIQIEYKYIFDETSSLPNLIPTK